MHVNYTMFLDYLILPFPQLFPLSPPPPTGPWYRQLTVSRSIAPPLSSVPPPPSHWTLMLSTHSLKIYCVTSTWLLHYKIRQGQVVKLSFVLRHVEVEVGSVVPDDHQSLKWVDVWYQVLLVVVCGGDLCLFEWLTVSTHPQCSLGIDGFLREKKN